MSAFSYALDLTEGQPSGHANRCAYVGVRMGRMLGLELSDLTDLYFTLLLKDLGCSSNAARIAELYATDDRAFKMAFKTIPRGLPATLRFVLSRTGAGKGWGLRARKVGNILRKGEEIARDLILTRCTRGAAIARRLRFSEAVAQGIFALDEHWDGSGKPDGISGDAIPLFARIALLAQVADVFFAEGGPDAAADEVRRRSGSWLDPELARLFERVQRAPGFWTDLRSPALDAMVASMIPPSDRLDVDEDFLDDIAAAFGEVVDAKSPFTGGHSVRVADYAERLFDGIGLADGRRRRLRRAALLHDVGKLGVSSTILEKPGGLEETEWAEMRGHADATRQILSRIGCLADMADLAAAHHERLDGTGYPLGLDEQAIAIETRIITTCDFYDALTAERPYRAAMSRDKALDIIGREVGKAVDPHCFDMLKSITA